MEDETRSMSDWRNDDFRKDLERRLGRFEEDAAPSPDGTDRRGVLGDWPDPEAPPQDDPAGDDGFGYSDGYDDPPPARRRVRPLRVALVILLLLTLGGVGGFVWHAYTTSQHFASGDDVPVIAADPGPPRVRPEQPGGMEVPHQERLVLRDLDPATVPLEAERLLPPPEEPIPRAPADAQQADGPETADGADPQWPPPPPDGTTEDSAEAPAPPPAVPPAVAGLRPDAARPSTAAPQVEALIPRDSPPPEAPRAAPAPEPAPSEPAPPPPPEPVPGLSVTFQLDRGGLRPVEPVGTADAPVPPAPPAGERAPETATPEPSTSETDAAAAPDPAAAAMTEELEAAAELPPPMPPGPAEATTAEPAEPVADAPAPAPPEAAPDPQETAETSETAESAGTPVAAGDHPPLPGRRPTPPESIAPAAPQVAATPDVQETAAPPAAPTTTAPTATAPTAAAQDGPVTGFRIQLSSVRSEAQAEEEWQRFQSRHREILGPLTLAIQQVELSGRGTFYRVQAGTAAGLSQAEAQALCRRLEAQNTECLLVRP